MAEFLTTTGVSAELEKIVSEARKEIFLISPYLKINQRMKDLLVDADRLRKDIRIVFGKNELQPDEGQWLQGLSEIRLYFRKNLHAKCYLNEQKAIVTSMNLYEFSQINNDEMGILVSASADAELYGRIVDETQKLLRSAEPVKLAFERLAAEPPVRAPQAASPNAPPRAPTDLIQHFGIKRTELKPEMIEARRTHPRAYEPWTQEEEDVVIELMRRRTHPDNIARILGRQPSAIERKIKDLG
jgi:phosphatidylserine/phosphatidylglycerophosphate/cardiolipin synthase-like enzyme